MIVDVHTHILRHNAIVAAEPSSERPDGFLYSIGIHPWHIASDSDTDALEAILGDPNIVAIGETGIDTLRGPDIELQKLIFGRHISLSERHAMPLIIHCVRAHDIILDLHRRFKPTQPWIIHGFRQKPTIARSLLDAGLYLSLGPRFNPATAAIIPPQRLLIETDDDPAADIATVAARVAAARGSTPAQILALSAENIARLI